MSLWGNARTDFGSLENISVGGSVFCRCENLLKFQTPHIVKVLDCTVSEQTVYSDVGTSVLLNE